MLSSAPANDRANTTRPEQVCAVVVTYNRKELLRECLHALLAQTVPLARILVVNNVSTDGTGEMLTAEFTSRDDARLQVLDLPRNVGGAGGFHAGMERAHADPQIEWLWLLDDDTIAEPDALERLVNTRERFEPGSEPVILASKVLWTDGSLHAMNQTFAKLADYDRLVAAAERATLSIRTATFVSLLLHRQTVTRYGLPLADYFIWGDDTEWTARVLREQFGVLAPASRVLHKTALNYTALKGSPDRFYYHVRNELWTVIRSRAWTNAEKIKRLVALVLFTRAFLRVQAWSTPTLRAIGRGVRDGLLKRPER